MGRKWRGVYGYIYPYTPVATPCILPVWRQTVKVLNPSLDQRNIGGSFISAGNLATRPPAPNQSVIEPADRNFRRSFTPPFYWSTVSTLINQTAQRVDTRNVIAPGLSVCLPRPISNSLPHLDLWTRQQVTPTQSTVTLMLSTALTLANHEPVTALDRMTTDQWPLTTALAATTSNKPSPQDYNQSFCSGVPAAPISLPPLLFSPPLPSHSASPLLSPFLSFPLPYPSFRSVTAEGVGKWGSLFPHLSPFHPSFTSIFLPHSPFLPSLPSLPLSYY